MWTLAQDNVAAKPQRAIRTTKSMFTIMWNPLGFHVIDQLPDDVTINANDRMFHSEVSISAPRLDLGSKSQQILTLAPARSILDFQLLGAYARTMPVDFSDALDIKPVR
jgi:hypothetical protein